MRSPEEKRYNKERKKVTEEKITNGKREKKKVKKAMKGINRA